MLSIVLAGSLLAVQPPALPEEPPATEVAVEPAVEPAHEPAPELAPAAAVEPASAPEPAPDVIVIEAAPSALPIAEEVAAPIVIVEHRATALPVPRPQAPGYVVPPPPWSGSGRFVGGSVMLIAGVGLLTAATLEFADGRDTTQPLISQVPAGVAMLVASGVMIGTAARDQRRLSEWEAATRIDARPSGNGLIVGGATALTLGSMAAIATSIAADMDLDAPRSIPAGWATAGLGLGAGTAMLVAGIVRRSRYGKWRDGLRGVPMVAPSRAGASLGFVGRF
ncbi:MAG TPA: hypothetical protein VK034_01930 [Enhygromyxa sp.]|nr:hypothetical protein [Enhygromyxa sp.]